MTHNTHTQTDAEHAAWHHYQTLLSTGVPAREAAWRTRNYYGRRCSGTFWRSLRTG